MKYQLEKLEIRSNPVSIPHRTGTPNISTLVTGVRRQQNMARSSLSSSTDGFDQVHPETGFYIHRRTIKNNSLFYDDDENIRLSKKTDEIRDALDESTLRINNELRKVALDLQNELEDIKRRLIR